MELFDDVEIEKGAHGLVLHCKDDGGSTGDALSSRDVSKSIISAGNVSGNQSLRHASGRRWPGYQLAGRGGSATRCSNKFKLLRRRSYHVDVPAIRTLLSCLKRLFSHTGLCCEQHCRSAGGSWSAHKLRHACAEAAVVFLTTAHFTHAAHALNRPIMTRYNCRWYTWPRKTTFLVTSASSRRIVPYQKLNVSHFLSLATFQGKYATFLMPPRAREIFQGLSSCIYASPRRYR